MSKGKSKHTKPSKGSPASRPSRPMPAAKPPAPGPKQSPMSEPPPTLASDAPTLVDAAPPPEAADDRSPTIPECTIPEAEPTLEPGPRETRSYTMPSLGAVRVNPIGAEAGVAHGDTSPNSDPPRDQRPEAPASANEQERRAKDAASPDAARAEPAQASSSRPSKPVDATRAWASEHLVDEAPEAEPLVISESIIVEAPAREESIWHPPPGPLRPGIPPMHIVHVSSELAPVAKVGGLADVVFGLSRELSLRGNRVEIVLPKYDCMRYDQVWGLRVCYQDLWVPWWGGRIHCTVWEGEVHGRKCFFIEPHSQEKYFYRGKFYGDNDDVLRFAFFSRAALEFLYKTLRHPDVIHCHDWQTALIPVFLYEFYQQIGMRHPRVCYTIHNFRHQGLSGEFLLWATELGRPAYFYDRSRLQDDQNPHALNLMKGGIVYSNFVTTVSPNYAWETQQDQGYGLGGTLHAHAGKYGGVVNGIDYDVWNPEVDRFIPTRYTAASIERKYDNKRALRNRLWIADNAKPILAFIGRLDDQKGLELIEHAASWAVNNSAQFVLLGTAPSPDVGHRFHELKRQYNDNPDCHIELSFDEDLSHLIYAGADMMLVPSRYEPCGLTQLIAMKYGTVPIVRAIGGLADTVFDKDHDWRPLHERNGYVFKHYDYHALDSTLYRAVRCYYEFPQDFRNLMLNGMHFDFSWNIPGQHYLNIYDYIRDR